MEPWRRGREGDKIGEKYAKLYFLHAQMGVTHKQAHPLLYKSFGHSAWLAGTQAAYCRTGTATEHFAAGSLVAFALSLFSLPWGKPASIGVTTAWLSLAPSQQSQSLGSGIGFFREISRGPGAFICPFAFQSLHHRTRRVPLGLFIPFPFWRLRFSVLPNQQHLFA